MNVDESNQLSSLVKDTLGMAILYSGYTKTVVGEKWISIYFDMLDDKDKAKVLSSEDYSTFRFGDGAQVVSTQSVQLPAIIGSKQISIKANVVKNGIPLLVIRNSMKKANTAMNFCSDRATMVDEEIPLYSTQCGHYCIPLLPRVKCQLSVKAMRNFVLHISSEFKCMPRKDKKLKSGEASSTICASYRKEIDSVTERKQGLSRRYIITGTDQRSFE